jgi:hypothetical protein
LTPNDVLQTDLNLIYEWSRKWLLTLNIDKCQVMHLGYNNPKKAYFMGLSHLNECTSQVDLGVTISNDLKWNKHIVAIVKKANQKLFCIKKSFIVPMDKKLFLSIYLMYVRPILEYASVIWSPYLVKDINLIENVQKRATKLNW